MYHRMIIPVTPCAATSALETQDPDLLTQSPVDLSTSGFLGVRKALETADVRSAIAPAVTHQPLTKWAWVDSNYRPHAYQARIQGHEWAHSARQISETLDGSRNLHTSADAV